LENAIERACVTALDGTIRPKNLPPELLEPDKAGAASTFQINLERPLNELLRDATRNIEQQYIRKSMEKSYGNVGRCAKLCGLSRRSVSAKIAEYNINKAAFKGA
jgi:DNA-binding NtrC family response regulator